MLISKPKRELCWFPIIDATITVNLGSLSNRKITTFSGVWGLKFKVNLISWNPQGVSRTVLSWETLGENLFLAFELVEAACPSLASACSSFTVRNCITQSLSHCLLSYSYLWSSYLPLIRTLVNTLAHPDNLDNFT